MSEINESAKDLTEETSKTTVEQTGEQIKAVHIGEPTLLAGPVEIVDYDPTWPQLFEREAARIRTALGNRILLLDMLARLLYQNLPPNQKSTYFS